MLTKLGSGCGFGTPVVTLATKICMNTSQRYSEANFVFWASHMCLMWCATRIKFGWVAGHVSWWLAVGVHRLGHGGWWLAVGVPKPGARWLVAGGRGVQAQFQGLTKSQYQTLGTRLILPLLLGNFGIVPLDLTCPWSWRSTYDGRDLTYAARRRVIAVH